VTRSREGEAEHPGQHWTLAKPRVGAGQRVADFPNSEPSPPFHTSRREAPEQIELGFSTWPLSAESARARFPIYLI
jgi:hypothetical protein